jgi:hypothetical protein
MIYCRLIFVKGAALSDWYGSCKFLLEKTLEKDLR